MLHDVRLVSQRLVAGAALLAALLVVSACGTKPAVVAIEDARSESSALKALDRLLDEHGGDALANAFCTGATSYVNKNEAPSGGDWGNYILSEAGLPSSQFQEKADQLGAALRLAEEQNGSAANAYVKACLAR